MSLDAERADRARVGVLFVDLLFALVVVELLEPLRQPERIYAEGWWQLGLAFTLTLLSWIGYHLSISRLDEAVHINSPTFVMLVLDVLMVAMYWLTAVSFEHISEPNTPYSWAHIPKPSAVPEAIFILATFGLYVAWDWTSRWIHTSWARHVNALRLAERRSPYDGDSEDRRPWGPLQVSHWRTRSLPTVVCTVAAAGVLVLAIITQQTGPSGVAERRWVIGLDVSLIAVVVGFRIGKEFASYRGPFNTFGVTACAVVFAAGIVGPLL